MENMRPLENRKVALLESRKADDLAALVRRFGGEPVCAPSVREVLRAGDFRPMLQRLIDGEFGLIVVLTAAACDALFAEADRQGLLDPVVAALAHTTLACRGPKPLVPLKRRALVPRFMTQKPHTTDELIEALRALELSGLGVLLLHYGERSESLSAALAGRGARVEDLCLYDWALPEDLGPLQGMVRDTLAGGVDAMLFTSQIQFRHLMDVAQAMGCDVELTRALRDDVIVASVGPVCSRALRAGGIVPDVMPHSPNGPSLIQAVADYFSMFNPNEEITS
jgi:uroporphyrinogen-III synthase